MDDADVKEPGRIRRFLRRRVSMLSLLILIFILLLIGIWVQRTDIADRLVQNALENADVAATYEIADIGFRTQKIRNLIIGDPTRPDLTADEIDISFDLFGSGTDIVRLRAKGVRIWGRIEDGKLRLGELDKLRDMTSDAPFGLPSFRADLEDVRLRIDTPTGPFALALSGRGRVDDGFDGTLALISRGLDPAGCSLGMASYAGDLAIRSGRAALDGRMMLGALGCGDANVALASLGGNVNLTLSEDMTGGEAKFALEGRRLEAGQLAALSGMLSGTPLDPLGKKLADALRNAGASFTLEGALALGGGNDARRVSVEQLALESESGADIAITDGFSLLIGDDSFALDDNAAIKMAGGGLPDLTLSVAGNSINGFSGKLDMTDYRADDAMLAISNLRISPAGEGRTRLIGGVRLSGPIGGGQLDDLAIPLVATLGPNGRFAAQPGCFDATLGGWAGSPFALGRNRMKLCPPTGRYMVESTPAGLAIQAGAGRQALSGSYQQGPASIGWRSFSIAKAPSGSIEGRARQLRLQLGRAANGQTVTAVSALLKDGRFALTDAAYLSRAPGGDTRAQLARLSGTIGGPNGPSGELTGFSGEIRNVPLDISEAGGRLSLQNGALTLVGSARVAYDSASVGEGEQPVFEPVRLDPLRLWLKDGIVHAEGPMLLEETGREVARLDLRHGLSSGAGDARIVVDHVGFDEGQQPYQLFPAAFGVVSNVNGSVSGTGTMVWDADGVRSEGSFDIADTDLAAAFGTVSGLSGTVRFNDLLGLETAPGQTLSVQAVNPGIEVRDGQVSFQLLSGMRVRVERGEWPFAGGRLVLRPSILDFSSTEPRYLSFYMEALDATKFVNEMGYENISASGIFDGEMPMVFDADGGRIDNGRLLSRPGGGTLAYLGELSYQDMGVFANFAFDALKSIRYDRLEIVMNGEVAGEIITEIQFSGLQQGEGAKRNFITRRLAKLPLQFNININAPFMELLGTLRGMSNPDLLVRRNYDALLEEQRRRDALKSGKPPVQPAESGSVP